MHASKAHKTVLIEHAPRARQTTGVVVYARRRVYVLASTARRFRLFAPLLILFPLLPPKPHQQCVRSIRVYGLRNPSCLPVPQQLVPILTTKDSLNRPSSSRDTLVFSFFL